MDMRGYLRGSIFTVLMTLIPLCSVHGSSGSLDLAFGNGGVVLTGFAVEGEALVVQPDGKLVVAGCSRATFTLVRYQHDGSLDHTFGERGTVRTRIGDYGCAFALVLQPDGKLVAAGEINENGRASFTLVRYLPNGRLDRTFGKGGQVRTFFGGQDSGAYALLRQPDGKLVAAGWSASGLALARYLPDGSLDSAFGSEGQLITTDLFGGAQALALQADGKLVVAGYIAYTFDFLVVRYLPDGRLDPSFGSGGWAITDSGATDMAQALVVRDDGKLVVPGNSHGNYGFVLVGYLPDGNLDPSFGVGGLAAPGFGGWDSGASGLVRQPDGKLVASGNFNRCYSDAVCLSQIVLVRFLD